MYVIVTNDRSRPCDGPPIRYVYIRSLRTYIQNKRPDRQIDTQDILVDIYRFPLNSLVLLTVCYWQSMQQQVPSHTAKYQTIHTAYRHQKNTPDRTNRIDELTKKSEKKNEKYSTQQLIRIIRALNCSSPNNAYSPSSGRHVCTRALPHYCSCFINQSIKRTAERSEINYPTAVTII